jgi:hypothetical protein
MRTASIDVGGQAALSQLEGRLRARGYELADGPLQPGLYTWHPFDVMPGWAEWIYGVTVALRDGDELAVLIEGLFER